MSFDNIPLELQQLNQWVVWKLEDIGAKKPTKIPYDAKNTNLANVNEPDSWTSFDIAVSRAIKDNYSGIGFVFTNNDPYTFIDLDDTEGDQIASKRQIEIFREFDSYSEISPSGKGLHVIIKGSVPNGRRRSFIEIYSSQRYATFTGNVYNNKPIAEQQDKLTQLWEQMASGGPATLLYQGDDKEKHTDEQILEQARNATNGDKFKTLHSGNWKSLYQSQSEADFAFIDIVAFYTQNRNQITRMFRNSALGTRDKAKRQDYIERMIIRSFDRMLPQLDFDGFKNQVEDYLQHTSQSTTPQQLDLRVETEPIKSSIIIPQGLMGELAQFIFAASPRPVPEIALAGAIGLMAGICGRAYNISGTGLNQYVLVLAKTGRGKEAAASGIDKLMNAIRLQVPTSTRFRGPGIINSGQALIKHLSKVSNCFVSILGEFGITIDKISSRYANSSDKMLYQMLLDLYNKSGHGQTLQASIYSKKEDNVDITNSPALSILGESTHKIFYETLSEDMISAGLLPRFLIIEYNGKRVSSNENHVNVQPPFQLIDQLASLVANCEMIMHANKVIDIQITDEALKILRSFDKYADDQINSEKHEIIEELWNRAHMKALRLAGLVAVGCNMSNPIVLPDHALFAINVVQSDIRLLAGKFELGEIGTNSHEIKQLSDLIKVIKEYTVRDWEIISKYQVKENLYKARIIPYHYLSLRLLRMASFRNDTKSGATNALKRAIQNLLDTDKLREVNKQELAAKHGTTQRAFIISDVEILN